VLDEIRIAGLGVIEDAVLELAPGLTVVTGETGAGKTMVVQGLNLLLGGRADPALIRPSSGRTLIEGRIALAGDNSARARALAAGAELDDGALLVSRTVSAPGRSRAFLGGRAVPATLLAGIAEELVTVHGQADQMRLLRPPVQRAALDRFAGAAVTEPLARYRRGYQRWREVAQALAELTTQARERARQADLLRFGLAEIEAAAPVAGEEDELATEVARLAHADTLRTAAGRAADVLVGDPVAGDSGADATGLVALARRALDAAAAHDPGLAALADRLAGVSYALADVATDLAAYADGLDADPRRLAAAQDRQAVLRGLLRKYGEDVAAVLAWAREAAERLAELDDDGSRLHRLTAQREELVEELGRAAAAVSLARAEAAARFGTQVSAELAELAMPGGRVEAALSQRLAPEPAAGARSEDFDPDAAWVVVAGRRLVAGPDGVDEVELRLTPHLGAPARPLQRGASGGELSRVMLAVEVVFAAADPVPTMVFDEVDAGVGGRTAVEIGRRLARLARSHQVVVVTHLPQVAAFADRHLVVAKADDGSVTRSGVTAVEGPARVAELSRMLAGLAESELARGHAQELLAAAAAAKGAQPQ
jgi:DNA repair protein RecN (Recombination protein N)